MSSPSNETYSKIVKLVISDDLLSKYNYDGSFGKKKFSELKINDLLCGKFFESLLFQLWVLFNI